MKTGSKQGKLIKSVEGMKNIWNKKLKEVSTIYRKIKKGEKVSVTIYCSPSYLLGKKYYDIKTEDGFACKVSAELVKFIIVKTRVINKTVICESEYFSCEQIVRTEAHLDKVMKLCKKIQDIEIKRQIRTIFDYPNYIINVRHKYNFVNAGMKIQIIDNE